MNNRLSDAELNVGLPEDHEVMLATLAIIADGAGQHIQSGLIRALADAAARYGFRAAADRLAQPSEPEPEKLRGSDNPIMIFADEPGDGPAPAWEAVARNLAATVEDGAEIFERVARAHGIPDTLIHRNP